MDLIIGNCLFRQMRWISMTAILFVSGCIQAQSIIVNQVGVLYLDPSIPFEKRVDDLVSRMTLSEKISQMDYNSPSIPRLGIPQYTWWNECLHGVARNGIATVFPQAIGMASTWDIELIRSEADVISTEARAKYYEAIARDQHAIYQGLTFWSPNINIFRDPRWGRGQETYGEDPFLTAQIGKAFVQGLQGTDPKYLKVVSTAKHFAVHSGPEPERHRFDAWPSQRDLYDTYLPAFEALVKEAGVYSVMSCYNRVYGIPASASMLLLDKILRKKWGFKGYVVSDCWAISDMYNFHNFVPDAEKASSLAVSAGVDLACGPEYGSLVKAIQLGYTSEHEIDVAVKRLMLARFRLGLFDPPSMVSYASISPLQNNTSGNRELARKVAQESIVLLKNENQTLPFSSKIKSIAVIGPYAQDTSVLLGNYNGVPSAPVTVFEGIKKQAKKGMTVLYAKGAERPEVLAKRIKLENNLSVDNQIEKLEHEALNLALKADVVVFCGGISPQLEGEDMDVKVKGFAGGDRTDLELPSNQQQLLEKLSVTGKPIIFIVTNGSALALNWAQANLPSIVEVWYPGEEGGNAIADVLFGNYNPAGRLPVTFYKSITDIPAFDNYSMEGRTYRYFRSEPLYPFGYGLSYSTFKYQDAILNKTQAGKNDTLTISVRIKNTSQYAGDEVVQLYIRQPGGLEGQPIRELKAFKRANIPAGMIRSIELSLPVSQLRHFEPKDGEYVIAKGSYELQIGASSADIRLKSALEIK
jgi:beta-glucosidase